MTPSRLSLALLALLPAACRQPGAPAPAAAAPARATAQPGARVLWHQSVDMDGDGKPEDVVLESVDASAVVEQHDEDPRIDVPITACEGGGNTCTAILRVGKASQPVDIQSGYFGGVGLQIIDIDTSDGRKEVLVQQRGDNDEDPWFEFWVAIYDGKQLRYHALWHSSGYNSGSASAVGDGRLVVRYEECPDSYLVEYTLRGTQLVETDRDVVRVRNPDECAACPYVYVVEPGGTLAFRGEILRNLNRPELEGRQSLPLGSAAQLVARGLVTVELAEEKAETTFLDEVHLQVGDARVAPRECAGAAAPAFCAADGAYQVLRQGERLRLTFAVDGAGGADPVRLVADGFYLPE